MQISQRTHSRNAISAGSMLALLLAIALLSACGGSGGSGSSSSNTPPAPPSASYSLNNDSAFVMPGETIIVDVLANDAVVLELQYVSQASLGSVTIAANQIEYTAGSQGSQNETLEYVAQDLQGDFGGAMLEIYIAPSNVDISGFADIIDINGDGISEQELIDLGVNLPAGTFALYDLNANGVLDPNEFDQFSLEFLNTVALPAFDAADLNGDGELDIDEAINFLPAEISGLITPEQLGQVDGFIGDITLSPNDVLQISADFQQAQETAQSQAGQIMLVDSFLGNSDGLLSSAEIESALALSGSLPIALPIPDNLDAATVGQVVDILDFDNNGGLDQQEAELLLTLANMLGSLQSL